MALTLGDRSLSAEDLSGLLQSSGLLDPFAIRQAAFFARRLAHEPVRPDFQVLLLLLLSCLRKGLPRAGAAEFARMIVACTGAAQAGGGHEKDADIRDGRNTFPSLMQALEEWLDRLFIHDRFRLSPLAAHHPGDAGIHNALVIYDSHDRTVSFQACFLSEKLLHERIPVLLDQFELLDSAAALSALGESLAHTFHSRTPHIRQIQAALTALQAPFLVISGGPGSGKSTLVHLMVQTVCRYHKIDAASVMLCAPTGRAKARLLEAVARDMPPDSPFAALQARTLHALLGIAASGTPAWSHLRPLPWRLIVVDEVSMVDVRLFALLIDALAPHSRLILIGDMDQLPAVQPGAILGDLTSGLVATANRASLSEQCLQGHHAVISRLNCVIDGYDGGVQDICYQPSPMRDHLVYLVKNFRSDRAILQWWQSRLDNFPPESPDGTQQAVICIGAAFRDSRDPLVHLADWVSPRYRRQWDEWRDIIRPALLDGSDIGTASVHLRRHIESLRILCCIHDGPLGRRTVNDRCNRIVCDINKARSTETVWHDGTPLIVNRNHPELELYNGDCGVVLDSGTTLYGCFPTSAGVHMVALERLRDSEPAYALSVHKAQGSEFDEILLLIPDMSSGMITRQIIYTAITRARHHVTIIDPGDCLVHAGDLPVDDRPGLLRSLLTPGSPG